MMAKGHDGLVKALTRAVLVLASVTLAAAVRYKRPTFCDTRQASESEPLSFLWSLKRDPPAYFFGTIHVPYTRVWDHVPDNAKLAFEHSQNVFFELDLMNPYTIAALSNCQMLPSGKSLADVLPGDLYDRLKRHLDYVKVMMPTWMTADQRGRGLYAEYLFSAITGDWQRKRPIWVMLMVNSLTESDVKSRGIPVLDLYLAQEAQRMDKRSGAVERVEEQCVPLNGLNFTQVLFALNYTLHQQESLRSGDPPFAGQTTDDLVRRYNCGDLDLAVLGREAAQVSLPPLNETLPAGDRNLAREVDRYFRKELIDKRNARMGERVIELLRNYPDETFFFAFGAGHFLGNDTVLDYVKSKGFKVEQVPANKKIRSSRKPHHHPHHRHKGSLPLMRGTGDRSVPWTNDLGQTAWEEQSSRSGRRRYRKRGHHQGVHLLRTSSTIHPRVQQRRTFNDLWIKLETFTRLATRHQPPTQSTPEVENFRKKMRTWYGLPNSAISHLVRLCDKLLWTLCMTILWTFHTIRTE